MADSQQGLIVVLAIFFMILPVLAVACRVWIKISKKTRLMADDYMILLSLVFTTGTGVCQLLAATVGNLGQHLTYTQNPEIPDQLVQLVYYLQVEYAFEILAQLAIVSAKLSLVLLYRRIFVSAFFKRAVWVVSTLIVVWHGAFFFAFIFQCTPIAAVWDLTLVNATCVNKVVLWEAYAISDVLTDTLVLSMPIPAVLQLQMARKHQLAVILVFLLGAIVIATGITRTVFFFQIAQESVLDITYTSAPCLYWSFIETSLGTVCACLPTLRPFFAQHSVTTFIQRVWGLMSLHSSKGRSRKAYSEERTLGISPPQESFQKVSDEPRERPLYGASDAYDVYVDSQPLVGVTAGQQTFGKRDIVVSQEIQQSRVPRL